jgi:hypothetical protein
MVTRSRGIGRSGSSCRNCTSCSTVTKPQRTQVLMPGIGELAGAAFCSLPHAPQARNDNWPAAAPPAACWVFEASRNRCRSCMCSSQSAGVGCSSICMYNIVESRYDLRATTVHGGRRLPRTFFYSSTIKFQVSFSVTRRASRRVTSVRNHMLPAPSSSLSALDTLLLRLFLPWPM